ncbi:MAG TPA: efflux RND transporter periplasmic adaptor subunit [Vicinamibacterales bacterium]|nr:efflux RND transporter periplasmic adaptor subunit [Vicinamibacterales bacterium]
MTELKDDLAALRIEREPESASSGRWVRVVVLLLILGGGGLAAWKYLTAPKPVEVEVATVSVRSAGTQAQVLNANGYVVARRRATISSKITGKIVEVNVEEGMAIKEGQVLARLDDTTMKAALALAEAQAGVARRAIAENEVRLDEAKKNYARMAGLLKDGIVTQADVDAAKANQDSVAARIVALQEQTKVADRQIDLAKTDLDNTIIRAPFSGVAISKDAQPGEMVSPVSAGGGFTRTGICTIVDMRSLEVEVDVNETYINRVAPGQAVLVTLNAYPDWQIPGHVITPVPTGDRQKATVLVRIAFDKLDPRILPDMGIKVAFLRDDSKPAARGAAPAEPPRPTALAPKAAIKTEGDQAYVFVVVDDSVERRAITTGGTDGDQIEVRGGLKGGERVVVSPPPELAPGKKITIKGS